MRSKKILLVTHVSGFVPQFEMNNVQMLQKMGFEIHYASNFHMPSYGNDNKRLEGTGIICHQIDFVRSPFKLFANIKAYKQLLRLLRAEKFALLHCHTPMGGVLARLAAKRTHTKPIIYTAHGFHFYQGAPLINWLFYYPMEWLLSFCTTQLICINQEDYQRAKKCFRAKWIDYIPGVGIKLNESDSINESMKQEVRRELGIGKDTFVLIASGELIKRKNHASIIRALGKLVQHERLKEGELVLLICGKGALKEELEQLVSTEKLEKYVKLLGYRTDMKRLLQLADAYIFPSYQEGLPMGLLEAMTAGLPVICSEIRGNEDLMLEAVGIHQKRQKGIMQCGGGFMAYPPDDIELYAKAIFKLMHQTKEKRKKWGAYNQSRAANFSIQHVGEKMWKIYQRALTN